MKFTKKQLFEELKTSEENIIDTGHEKILMMKNGNGYNWDHISDNVSQIIDSARTYDINKVSNELTKFIPEYLPEIKSLNQQFKPIVIDKIR